MSSTFLALAEDEDLDTIYNVIKQSKHLNKSIFVKSRMYYKIGN